MSGPGDISSNIPTSDSSLPSRQKRRAEQAAPGELRGRRIRPKTESGQTDTVSKRALPEEVTAISKRRRVQIEPKETPFSELESVKQLREDFTKLATEFAAESPDQAHYFTSLAQSL